MGDNVIMKKILTIGTEILGPYPEILETEDRYIIGNTHMQYSIVGKGVISEVPDDYINPTIPVEQPTEILVEEVPTEEGAV